MGIIQSHFRCKKNMPIDDHQNKLNTLKKELEFQIKALRFENYQLKKQLKLREHWQTNELNCDPSKKIITLSTLSL